jgi:YihY family inner membrane protein
MVIRLPALTAGHDGPDGCEHGSARIRQAGERRCAAAAASSEGEVSSLAASRTRVGRIDAFQRRHPVLGFPIAVVYKFVDDQGIYLAALLTYYGFLSLFPLLLLLASILGFALRGDDHLRQQILDSTLSQFPVIGDQLRHPQGLEGSGVALVVGGLTALYGALGVAQALQNAMNVAWAVPRNRRPNPLKARLRSVVLLATAGVAVLATTSLSVFAGTAGARGGVLSSPTAIAVTVAAIVLNTAIFVALFRIGTARQLGLGDVIPGAVLAAVLWQVMQVFGTAYVAHVVKDSSATYGTFAFVLGLLAWAFIVAIGVVVSIEINVVRSKHLYPRSLLTPFTDDVDLTAADCNAYRDAATAQQHKGFEEVTVTFAHDGLNATARRSRRPNL